MYSYKCLGGGTMNHTQGFWKSPWRKEFIKFSIGFVILTFIYAVIFYVIISSPERIPFEYVRWFYWPILILIWCIFFLGLVGATLFPHVLGRIGEKIFELNDISFSEDRSKKHIIALVVINGFLLFVNFIYFISLNIYDPIKTLLLAWVVLIFIRAAHYVNPKMGSRIGALIVSFFLPYGLFLTGIYGLDTIGIVESSFVLNVQISIVGLFFLYYAIILSAHLPIEVLLEYIGRIYHGNNQQEPSEENTSYQTMERRTMNLKKHYSAISKILLTLGIMLLIGTSVGLCVDYFFYDFITDKLVQFVSIPFSIGFAFIGISLSFSSSKISNEIKDLTGESKSLIEETNLIIKNSNDLMKKSTQISFLQINRELEIVRKEYQNDPTIRKWWIWISVRLIEEASGIKDEVDPKYHEITANLFKIILKWFPWNSNDVDCEEMRHIIRMFESVLKFDFPDDKKDKLVDIFIQKTGLHKKNGENSIDYINRVKKPIYKKKDREKFQDVLSEIRIDLNKE